MPRVIRHGREREEAMRQGSCIVHRIAGLALAAGLAMAFSGSVRAQEQQPQQPPQTPTDQQGQGSLTPAGYTEIVISAPRMDVPYKEAPGATTVVGQEVLQEAPRAISAAETLKLVPGVNV